MTITRRALLTNFKSLDHGSQSEFASMAHVGCVSVLNGVGSQTIIDQGTETPAVAVCRGDVAASLPGQGTAALVLLGLAGAACAHQRPLEDAR